MKTFFLGLLLMGTTPLTIAHADGDHAAPKGSSRVGPEMAVTAFDPDEGFKMSEKAIKTLGIELRRFEGKSLWLIPKDALVRIKHSAGVYRRVDGWISFVLVQPVSQKGVEVLIQSADLEPKDEIAVRGATLLRLTEADLHADTVDSCSH